MESICTPFMLFAKLQSSKRFVNARAVACRSEKYPADFWLRTQVGGSMFNAQEVGLRNDADASRSIAVSAFWRQDER